MYSVVIPVHDHAPYLAAAVASALRSPLASEILLVDDGSRDGSAELVDRLAHGHPTRIRDLGSGESSNRGAPERLNQLVGAAREDWVAVLNSDDAFLPGRLETIQRSCGGNGGSFVYGHLLVADERGRIIGSKRSALHPEFPFPPAFDPEAMLKRGDHSELLANQNIVATTSNMVFTKRLHGEVGGFRDLRFVHDWDFALRASLLGQMVYLPQFLTLYRMHPSNTIKAPLANVAAEVLTFVRAILADFPELEAAPRFQAALQGNRYLELGQSA